MSNDEGIDQAVLAMLEQDASSMDMVWDINMEKMQYKTAAFLLADPNDYILELFGVMYNTKPGSLKVTTKSSSIAMYADGEGFDLDDMNELMSVFFIGRDETNPLIKKYGGLASAIRTALNNTASEISIESNKNGTPITYTVKKIVSAQPTKADKLKSMRFGDTQLTFQHHNKSSVKKGTKITIKKDSSAIRQILDLFTTKGIPEYAKINENCDFSLIPVELNGNRLEGKLFQTKSFFLNGEQIRTDKPEYMHEVHQDGFDARLYFVQTKCDTMVHLLKSGVSYPYKNIDLISRPFIGGIIDSQQFVIDMGKDRGIKMGSSLYPVQNQVNEGIIGLYQKMIQEFKCKLADSKKGVGDLHSIRYALQLIATNEINSLWNLYEQPIERVGVSCDDGAVENTNMTVDKPTSNIDVKLQKRRMTRSMEQILKVTRLHTLFEVDDYRRELAKLPIVETLDGTYISLEDLLERIEQNPMDHTVIPRNVREQIGKDVSLSDFKGAVRIGYSRYALDEDLVKNSLRATDTWLKTILSRSSVLMLDVNKIQDDRDKKTRSLNHVPIKRKASLIQDYVKGFFTNDEGKRKSLGELLGEAGIGIVGGIGILGAAVAISPLIIGGVVIYYGSKYTYKATAYSEKKISRYTAPVWAGTKRTTKIYARKSWNGFVDHGAKPAGKAIAVGAKYTAMPFFLLGAGLGMGAVYAAKGVGAAGRWTGGKIHDGFTETRDGYRSLKKLYLEQIVDRYKARSLAKQEEKRQALAALPPANDRAFGPSTAYAGRGIAALAENAIPKKDAKTSVHTQYFWKGMLNSYHAWRAERKILKEKRKFAKEQQLRLDLEAKSKLEEQKKLTREERMVQLKQERWKNLRNQHADEKLAALEKAGFVVQGYADFIHSLEGLPKNDIFVGLTCYIHNEAIDASTMDTKGTTIFRTRDIAYTATLGSPESAATVLASTDESAAYGSHSVGHVFINSNTGSFEKLSEFLSTKYGAIAHSPLTLAYLNKDNTERLLWSTRRYRFMGFQPEQDTDKKHHFDNVNPISMQVMKYYYDKFQYLKDERVGDVMDLYKRAQNDDFMKAYPTLDAEDAKKLVTQILRSNESNPTIDNFIESVSPELVKEVGRTLV
jgi:hypothetical protein